MTPTSTAPSCALGLYDPSVSACMEQLATFSSSTLCSMAGSVFVFLLLLHPLMADKAGPYYRVLYCDGTDATLDCTDKDEQSLHIVSVSSAAVSSGGLAATSCGAEHGTSTKPRQTDGPTGCVTALQLGLCLVCSNKKSCRLPAKLPPSSIAGHCNAINQIQITYKCRQETGARHCVNRCAGEEFPAAMCEPGTVINNTKPYYMQLQSARPPIKDRACDTERAAWADCLSTDGKLKREVEQKCLERQSCEGLVASVQRQALCGATTHYMSIQYECVAGHGYDTTGPNGVHLVVPVAVVLAVLAILAVTAFLLVRRRRAHGEKKAPDSLPMAATNSLSFREEGQTNPSPGYVTGSGDSKSRPLPQRPLIAGTSDDTKNDRPGAPYEYIDLPNQKPRVGSYEECIVDNLAQLTTKGDDRSRSTENSLVQSRRSVEYEDSLADKAAEKGTGGSTPCSQTQASPVCVNSEESCMIENQLYALDEGPSARYTKARHSSFLSPYELTLTDNRFYESSDTRFNDGRHQDSH